MDSATFELVLKFLYTGEVSVSPDTLGALLRAADVLGIQHLQQLCRYNVRRCLTLSNCAGIWGLAKDLGEEEMGDICREFVLDNFMSLLDNQEFRWEVRAGHLEELLTSRDLLVSREEDLVVFIKRWVELDPRQREPRAAALLRKLKLGLLSRESMRELLAWWEQLEGRSREDTWLLALLQLAGDSHQVEPEAMEEKVRSFLQSQAATEDEKQREKTRPACLPSLSTFFHERSKRVGPRSYPCSPDLPQPFMLAIGGKRGDAEMAAMSR
eukprot:768759-Hanusia_phi.AAC.5